MSEISVFEPGGYRFIPGVFQYSGGVGALPGYRIVRVQLLRPLPLSDGFHLIERTLRAAGRPLTAFCACELRSPAPFTESGFREFNESYTITLRQWSLFDGTTNPVARSNVCPMFDPPPTASFHAFAYTEPADMQAPSFIISGSAEAPEGRSNYKDHIIRRGDVTPDGLGEKARYVLGEMERRLAAFSATWRDISAAQVYTVHDIFPLMRGEILARSAAAHGLTWQFCRPPVVDLEYEMDCRRVGAERVIDPVI
ncbi:MAG: hypothetical protein AB7K04_09765 [Pseudorhodoplanes sp.]